MSKISLHELLEIRSVSTEAGLAPIKDDERTDVVVVVIAFFAAVGVVSTWWSSSTLSIDCRDDVQQCRSFKSNLAAIDCVPLALLLGHFYKCFNLVVRFIFNSRLFFF